MAKRRGRKKKIKAEDLLKLKMRGEKEGLKYGKMLSSPEDAGQEYVTRLLEGKHRKSTVQQAFIDMAREEGGRPGQPGHEAKKPSLTQRMWETPRKSAHHMTRENQ